jgi:2-polyprenyl-3-methyl-5-hydroxy-6-metoxy-1,4-benzoquinol methylase
MSRQQPPSAVQLLALYLPQFHPIPENDEFWGPGFTEWTSTVAAQPRYSDHRQPRLAGELGMYDLRLAEVATQQETLATEYGIDAFVYYHYWFEGRRVMGGPLDAKRADPTRTMPFALCWANHDWNRNQNGLPAEILIQQTYSETDDLQHAQFLAETFADPRYLRTPDGRPIFFMYRTQEHPDPQRFAAALRAACEQIGVTAPYLVRFETNGSQDIPPDTHGFDAGSDLHPHWLWHTDAAKRPQRLEMGIPGDFWLQYDSVAAASSARSTPPWRRFPCVAPDWDTTARKPLGGANALHRSSVLSYETWLSREVSQQLQQPDEPRFVVLNAWNEWSECGYLEPDAEQGRALLEATARAKGSAPPLADPPADMEDDLKMYDLVIDPQAPGSAYRWILELVPSTGTVLEVGCGAGHLTEQLQLRGNVVTAVDINPLAAARAGRFAAVAFDLDLDRHLLSERLRGQQFDCILLADVLEHVRSSQRVLTDALALLAPDGVVVVSVPNIAHIDSRLMLLQGQWNYRPTGLLDDSHLRFFTRASLVEMLRDSGLEVSEWRRTERPPFATNLGVDAAAVPSAVVAHLLTDPDATTYQFIVAARRGLGADTLERSHATPLAVTSALAGDRPLHDEVEQLKAELQAYQQLKILRIARIPRAIYGRVRRAISRRT